MTGAAGFIGSAVCRSLVGEQNATVLNVDKLTDAAKFGVAEDDRKRSALWVLPSRHL
jgi:dTDP-D-glucose 4,6-dehydratase